MMADSGMNACSMAHKLIRSFLEDLLNEREYQSVRVHLEECATCRRFAVSVGSLSYQLREMSEVIEVPKDLLATILYQLRHLSVSSKPQDAANLSDGVGSLAITNVSKTGSKWMFVLIVAAVLMAGLAVNFKIFPTFNLKKKASSAPVAEKLLQENLPDPLSAGLGGPLLRWELGLSSEGRQLLFDILRELSIPVNYQSSQLAVITVPKETYRELLFRVKSIEGIRADFGKDPAMNDDSATAVQITVYFPEISDGGVF